jgi:hypothetical protein
MKAYQFAEVQITDPDTKMPVDIAIYKAENGGVFGVDSSFVYADEPIYDPFDGELVEEKDI